ncbi:MAG: ATP-binding protein [Smithella sp.]|jgi:two-component system sensor histidine kinase PilS (NtrC family)
MHEETFTKEKNTRRLFFLIISRVVITTFFLGMTIFMDIRRQSFPILQTTINFFYFIAAAVYLFSVIYILLFKFGEKIKNNLYIQITVDIIVTTILIFIFGNTQIDYSLFYTLIIIYSVIFIGRKGGMIVASVTSIFYGLILDLEFYKLIPSMSFIKYEYEINAADTLTNVMVHIVSFYVLAFLVSFAVEQEKKAIVLLKEKESAFNQLDLLFHSIIESVDTGVMTIDLNRRIKTFNRAAEEITGFKFAVIKNDLLENIIPEFMPLFEEKELPESLRNRMDVKIKAGMGNNIHLGCSISSLSSLKDRDEKKIGHIIIFQDLTEIKQMEEKLEKSRKLALIGEMAAGLAHEMRNPLAAISGSIELLLKGLEFKGTNRRLMGIILRGTDQLENLVRDFLSLARPVPALRELVDINEVFEEVLEHIKVSKSWTDKIEVIKVFSDDVRAYANKEQVRQVINNLVLNAVQAMEEGGVLSFETKLDELEENKQYAQIKVSDTGCGIKETDLNKIFDTFFTNKEKGIGLGLPIVNHIVAGYNGKIKIESVVNKGTICYVWLPIESRIHSRT